MPKYSATVTRETMEVTRSEVTIEATDDADANRKLRELEDTLQWKTIGVWIVADHDETDDVDGIQRAWVEADPQP